MLRSTKAGVLCASHSISGHLLITKPALQRSKAVLAINKRDSKRTSYTFKLELTFRYFATFRTLFALLSCRRNKSALLVRTAHLTATLSALRTFQSAVLSSSASVLLTNAHCKWPRKQKQVPAQGERHCMRRESSASSELTTCWFYKAEFDVSCAWKRNFLNYCISERFEREKASILPGLLLSRNYVF